MRPSHNPLLALRPHPRAQYVAKRVLLAWLIIAVGGLLWGRPASAQDPADAPAERILSARVDAILEEGEVALLGQRHLRQILALTVDSGPRRGERLVVEHEVLAYAGEAPYRPGDRLYVAESEGPEGALAHYVVGYARWPRLLWLGLLFVGLVLLVGRGRGLRSLLGLALSFAILVLVVLPRLDQGGSPVAVALLGAALTLPGSYLLAHGLNRKTGVALVGSLIGLCLTGLLALAWVRLARLSGYASEEAGFLQAMRPAAVDIRGLLLAGMIIGALGVLDDVTVSQAGIVQQLYEANRALRWRELYGRAMRVGQDHIASVVNTLALVYAGSSLPLLLLLGDRSLPLLYIASHEVVAEEIVRMLVMSCSLISVVPITTALAALATRWYDLNRGGDG